MNTKANIAIYGLMLGLTIIILALALAPSISESTGNAMNYTNVSTDQYGLDCSNSSISNFDKVTCYATDLTLFYFIGALLLIGGGVIAAKIIFT